VNDLAVSSWPADELLSTRTKEYLLGANPANFTEATRESDKTHHALVFEREDSASFLYKMETEPQGYDSSAWQRHIIDLPEEQARKLPSATRIGNTHFQLLTASHGVGSINFPQDPDGIIRRAPTAIYFEGPGHVYPTITTISKREFYVYQIEKVRSFEKFPSMSKGECSLTISVCIGPFNILSTSIA